MKRNEINGLSRPFSNGKHSFFSRTFKILDTDDSERGLMIAVRLLEQRNFLYLNNAFRLFFGEKKDKLLEHRWQFWCQNICPQESSIVKNRVKNFFAAPFDRKPITLKYHLYNGKKSLNKNR